MTYYLQHLASIHLNYDLRGEFEANGQKEYMNIFLVVSIFILLIACINFRNLFFIDEPKEGLIC